MLGHGHVSGNAFDDRAISPMAAALPHLHEPLALEDSVDLPRSEDSHR